MKNQKSKYRFYQSKSYIDKNGIRYSYNYKYRDVFHFFVFNANYSRAFFHEYQLDELQLQENKK